MRNIAIITARSGSKGLPDKNIKILNGKPLIYYSIDAAKKSGMFDEIMVSTDSEYYAAIAKSCGASVPFLRSEKMSGDQASSWDTVREVLEEYKKLGQEFDTVALLQPTSPLRQAWHIKEGYEMLHAKQANAIVGVAPMEHSPLWSNVLPADNSMKNFFREEICNKPRQELEQYYRVNGALYIVRVRILFDNGNIYEDGCYAYKMESQYSVDIDSDVDFKIAQILMDTIK